MGESDKNEIYLSSSPHFGGPFTTRHIMLSVVIALVPIAAWGVYLFGLPALLTIVTAVVSCVVFEALFRLATRQDIRVGDFSAVITGLLLALVLSPATPLWMTVLGSFFAIVVGKEFFGGLGANVFNPALTGRAFLVVSFAPAMTRWIEPRTGFIADAISTATPLGMVKADTALRTAEFLADKSGFFTSAELYGSLFFGQRGGCIGESAIFLILAAFVVLILIKVIDWRAPVAMMATTVLITTIGGLDPLVSLFSGGLVFGAVFMTTDYATSPLTPAGRLLFGFGCGLITGLIRVFGGFPEGVMFSILIMNATVPFLNKLITRKYGWVSPKKERAAK